MRFRPTSLFLAIALAFAVACSDDAPSPTSEGAATEIDLLSAVSQDPLLDGTADVDALAFAELARERALLGGRWLASVVQPDGSFYYFYDPVADEYEMQEYNEVRHAGTAYALYQLYGATGDADVLAAAEGASRYIDENSVHVADLGRAYVFNERMKLGGQALAIVALTERRRVLDDTTYDALINALARFMRVLERNDQPGALFNSYEIGIGPSVEPDSDYYPGEALFALARLTLDDPSGPHGELALRSADYLLRERDGDIPATGEIPRHDHWLVLALNELHKSFPEDDLKTVAYLQADDMAAVQWTAEDDPVLAGASELSDPVSFTSTATKGEALVAAWELAARAGDADNAQAYAEAARRAAQFSMRVQYLDDDAALFARPERLRGAWAGGPFRYDARIDYVQHNVSLLIGVWQLTIRQYNLSQRTEPAYAAIDSPSPVPR